MLSAGLNMNAAAHLDKVIVLLFLALLVSEGIREGVCSRLTLIRTMTTQVMLAT